MSHVKDEIQVRSRDVTLPGNLTCPRGAAGMVVFAHGSGSSRLSPRNRSVAQYLNDQGLATLLFDLLTPEEDEIDRFSRAYRFDIALLGRRLEGAVEWLADRKDVAHMKLGLFGASTGAAAALIAAAQLPEVVHAVVSRGGRPDLAKSFLERVRAPTLLIVGGLDLQVIELNKQAAARLECEHSMVLVAGATHLFEEPGTLAEVCGLAAEWFTRHLAEETPAAVRGN